MSSWRRRWATDDGPAKVAELIDRVARGAAPDDLAYGEHDGYLDLRGLPLHAGGLGARYEIGANVWEAAGIPVFKGVQLDRLDLRGADLGTLVVTDCSVSDCRLDKARIADLRVFASRWADCSFRNATASITFQGSLETGSSIWQRVDFTACDLRGSHTPGADFEACDFSDARFQGPVELGVSRLRECRFAGRVDELSVMRRAWHDPGAPEGILDRVDFSGAILGDVRFFGLDLSSCALPQDHNHIIVTRFADVVRVARRAIENDPDAGWPIDLELQIEAAADSLEADQDVGVITLSTVDGPLDHKTRAEIRRIVGEWQTEVDESA